LGAVARVFAWIVGAGFIAATCVLVLVGLNGPPEAMLEAAAPARKCPPELSIPHRAPGQPADEILNLRPVMNARDIEETLKCVSESYDVQKEAVKAAGAQESRVRIVATFGSDKIWASLYGAPGQEQAGAIWAERFFDVGEGPPKASIEGEMTQRFGPPHEIKQESGRMLLTWLYTPAGKPLRVKPGSGDLGGLWNYTMGGFSASACLKGASTDPAMDPQWDGRCGLTIRGQIDPSFSDPVRVSRWQILVFDQVTLARQAPDLKVPGGADKQP
jgi:hypothetical protein